LGKNWILLIIPIYAKTAFATALLLLLISGFTMAWQMPKLRKLTIVSASLGIALFVLKKSPIGQKLDFANHPYLCKGLLKKKICKQV
jgi:hypothetical protein